MRKEVNSSSKRRVRDEASPDLEAALKEAERLKEALTAAEEAAEQWRVSENFYRALIENASENITVVKADGTIVYVNPANERLFGYKPEFLIGKNSLDYLHPEDLPRVTEFFNRTVRDTGAVRGLECRYRHRDGSWRWVHAVGSSFLDDPAVEGVVVNSTDITERKRAEEALKRSEEYFRTLIENASDGITVLNADGSIRYQSPSVGRLFGYSQEDEIGNIIFDYVHPEDKPAILKMFHHLLQNAGATVAVECRYPAKDGSWGWIESVSRNLLDDPIVGGIVINYREITERKLAEEALRESEKRQQMAVLQERNRIAREIHDTLAQGFAGVIMQLEAADEVIDKDVPMARQYVDRARDLARENLREARRSVLDLRPQPLEELSLEESLDREVQKFGEDTGAKATFDMLGDVFDLSPEMEVALLRICQESLANVATHAVATEVEVNLVFEEGSVSLSVRDNGVGFDPGARYEGSYGLVGMRERVRLLGGTLEIRSEKGRGTLVEATFPCE